MDGLQTGRVPSAVRSLARLRLLKMTGQILMDIKTCPHKKKENEYINLKYGGQKSVQEKKYQDNQLKSDI